MMTADYSYTTRKRKHPVSDSDALQDNQGEPAYKKVNAGQSGLVQTSRTTQLNKSRRSKKMDTNAASKPKANDEEKRLRRFRRSPPQAYLVIKERALTQRLIVQHRERCGTDQVPEEKVLIAGSTGNLYTVHIGRIPVCDCPHAKKGHQCKHVIYVMLRVFKAPENIAYQLALTSSELRDLFARAPPIPHADSEAESSDGNRKPIEGECPICYCEFEPAEEAIVWCRAACGNNVHRNCMEKWMAASKGRPTCPYCRATWDDGAFGGVKAKIEGAKVSEEGYVNVAEQLGLSGERDYSTYHSYWARRQPAYGGW